MKKEEAHRFKHQIVVSPYLASDLDGTENQEIFVTSLDKRLNGEKLFAKIQFEMKRLSDEIETSTSEYRSISFFVYTSKSGKLLDLGNKAGVIIDAIQSFFLQYHQTGIECVHLVADNDIFRGILSNRVSKH